MLEFSVHGKTEKLKENICQGNILGQIFFILYEIAVKCVTQPFSISYPFYTKPILKYRQSVYL